MAVFASEAANGSFSTHPWARILDAHDVVRLLKVGLQQLWGFCIRAQNSGMNEHHYIEAMSYLLLVSLTGLTVSEVLRKTKNTWHQELQTYALRQVVLQLHDEIRDVCTSDCRRVITDPIQLQPDQISAYWYRLTKTGQVEAAREILSIESLDEACKVGLPLSREESCPVKGTYREEDAVDIPRLLQNLAHIIKVRAQMSDL